MLLIAWFIACASEGGGTSIPLGGQTGSEAPPFCNHVKTSELAVDEESPLGFSAEEILEYSEGDHSAELQWASGEVTTLAAEVKVIGPIRYEDLEPKPAETEGPPSEIEVSCDDFIIVPVRVSVLSGDGRLDDVTDGTLRVTHKEEATLLVSRIEPEALEFEVTEIDLEDYDGITFLIEASFGPSHFEGMIYGQATRIESDEVVSATQIEVAAWDTREPDI